VSVTTFRFQCRVDLQVCINVSNLRVAVEVSLVGCNAAGRCWQTDISCERTDPTTTVVLWNNLIQKLRDLTVRIFRDVSSWYVRAMSGRAAREGVSGTGDWRMRQELMHGTAVYVRKLLCRMRC
jgi:hypothetical protein